MERAQEENLIRGGASGLEEEEEEEEEDMKEMEDSLEQEEGTMTESPAFSFAIPRPSAAMRKGAAISKPPITPNKISRDTNFLKRSINNLSFTPERLTRKNPKNTLGDENSILKQVLVKLETPTQTVESQTTHILALEKQLGGLNTHSKGNVQANKASRAATKKIETMADRVAAMAAKSAPLSSQSSLANESQSSAKSSPNRKILNAKKTSPHLVVDLSDCASPLRERPLKDIRAHLQSSLKCNERNKAIEIKAMSRDNRQDHC